ncbi:MAG TPA: chemotaxis response regulator protein-glutamate methylesterase [candidate division Zixibacteria bacterium]|nr:chemotaxis response regulator protein-glutamate methylesterase [candidate division Zixibacteria bacterium]
MIKVLIVEDSPVVREFLTHILGSDSDIDVVGTACDGEEAVEAVERTRPDVVTMDIHMPRLNGFDATRRIMELSPRPIVIVSGSSAHDEIAMTFKALESGALAIVPRPRGLGDEESSRELVRTVKLMSEVRVVRRWPRSRTAPAPAPAPRPAVSAEERGGDVRVVAMGASTGGPIVLQTILSGLGESFPVPVLIVQHMTPGFAGGFAEWLARSTGFPVGIARDGETTLPGRAYVAPDGFHMGVRAGGRIALENAPPENGLRPSISYLFRSVVSAYGSQAVGVLLTGMGRDGAEELKLLRDKGCATIAQDRESCVVYGMPGEAVRIGAAARILSPDKIAAALREIVQKPPAGFRG